MLQRKTQGQKLVLFQIIESLTIFIVVFLTGYYGHRFESGKSTLALIIVAVAFLAIVKLFSIKIIGDVVHWYESLLDAIPFPLSVTDKDMNWTFVNKPVENMLKIKRKDVLGKHCSNWGAGICKTANCGVTCLRKGKPRTTFEQMGCDFQVDTAYILDKSGKQVGHIEVVQDISKMMTLQRAQTALFNEINSLCTSFIGVTDTVSTEAQALAHGSVEQADSVVNLSTSIRDISNMIDTNSQQSAQAASQAFTIQTDAEKGGRQMEEMMKAIQEIGDAGKSIEKIIEVIDSIAFQTNLLALNAAVEAARAGQYGKGFAVVAEEVRNLASRSAEAAQNTNELIANSIKKSNLGIQISQDAASSLEKIVQGIKENGQIISNISESARHQDEAIKKINSEIDQVSRIVEQNKDTAQHSAAASEELNSQTTILKKLLDDFNSAN